MDQLQIKDLHLRGVIGINEDERRDRQDILVNIALHADTRQAAFSDRVEDSVNYRTVTKRVIGLVESSRFYLVEKLAAEIARICLDESRVDSVTVRVEKPGALRFARSVGVEIHRTRADFNPDLSRALISIGSNIDSENNMREAVKRLSQQVRLLKVSPVYETLPVGGSRQPNFLNAATLIETQLDPEELKAQVLQPIEKQLGRVRTGDKNAPRTIDLDIALYGDRVVELGERHIPDPDILKHAHLALPLADLAPHTRHPENGALLKDIARSVSTDGVISRRTDVFLDHAAEALAEEARDE
jgi:dihydroneopterin aldolase/2-amino-4-hydroxy-6-hydroxymethyldihydropteridine diphosphokinase